MHFSGQCAATVGYKFCRCRAYVAQDGAAAYSPKEKSLRKRSDAPRRLSQLAKHRRDHKTSTGVSHRKLRPMIRSNLKTSPEAERLAREFFFDTQQTQSCLDLLAPSEDVYDLESTCKVLTFAAEHGISPVELAGFVSQLIARRMPLTEDCPVCRATDRIDKKLSRLSKSRAHK